MKLGFGLPNAGPAATPEGIVQVTQRAEELGYDSLWTLDRLFVPLKPQTGYVGTADGSYPEYFERVMDPLDVLAFAAAHSSRIRLGTSVLPMGYYHPLTLARRAATIDVLSGGRLALGMGVGWSKDEHDTMGVAMRDRARRADEFLQVLKRAWTDEVVEFSGEFFQVPASVIGLKPVQKPHPPLYLAAYSPGAMKRTATHADGWAPAGMGIDQMTGAMDGIRSMMSEAGRNPADLKLVVRGNIQLTPDPLEERYPFVGSWEQILSDIEETRRVGADELFIDPIGASPQEIVSLMERVRAAVG